MHPLSSQSLHRKLPICASLFKCWSFSSYLHDNALSCTWTRRFLRQCDQNFVPGYNNALTCSRSWWTSLPATACSPKLLLKLSGASEAKGIETLFPGTRETLSWLRFYEQQRFYWSFRGCWSFTQTRIWVTEPPFVWLQNSLYLLFVIFAIPTKLYLHTGLWSILRCLRSLQVGENFPSSVCQIFCWGFGNKRKHWPGVETMPQSRHESGVFCRSHSNGTWVKNGTLTKWWKRKTFIEEMKLELRLQIRKLSNAIRFERNFFFPQSALGLLRVEKTKNLSAVMPKWKGSCVFNF